jgi:8-oxo-dGTP pyrophosphatase MutT (NUDIX family)
MMQLATRLRELLDAPLPGSAAQQQFAAELAYGRHAGPPPWNARHAAVMILLYPQADQWHVPLTLRPGHLRDHAGQVSLPGGTLEAGESIHACALRELHEELGPLPDIDILGQLTPLYVFASNFWVTPCVGITDVRPEFEINRHEVARLLEPTLDQLFDVRRYARQVFHRRGIEFETPHIEFEGVRIWGATSMILGEFLALASVALNRPDGVLGGH